MPEQVTFHYDVGSPWCWLAGERIAPVLGAVAVWQPVLLAAQSPAVDRPKVDAAAAAQGLPPPRWPVPFPFDSTLAMLAATFAKQTGRAVAFSLAAMRQAFAGARDLSVPDNVLIAAAACEMHPRAVLAGAELRSTDGELRKQTVRAARAGVRALPAVVAEEHVFAGEAALERAATHMRASARAAASG